MQIKFSPQRRDDALVVEKLNDILTVNGEVFDFSTIGEGDTLPADAILSEFFAGPVERIGGEIVLTLLLPHGPNPSAAVAFPDPITVNVNGPVELPQ